jgi:hypothetical protein
MREEVLIYSTKDQVEEFLKSVIWKDMRRELVMWKNGFAKESESIVDNAAETNPSTASVLLHIGDLNGRKKTVDYLMDLPKVFLQVIEDRAKEKKRAEEQLDDENEIV